MKAHKHEFTKGHYELYCRCGMFELDYYKAASRHMDACRELLKVSEDEVLYEAIKEMQAENATLKAKNA